MHRHPPHRVRRGGDPRGLGQSATLELDAPAGGCGGGSVEVGGERALAVLAVSQTGSAAGKFSIYESENFPSASAIGVPEMIDEWVSAPYPRQQRDRSFLIAGLEWLDYEAKRRFDDSFVNCSENQQMEMEGNATKRT